MFPEKSLGTFKRESKHDCDPRTEERRAGGRHGVHGVPRQVHAEGGGLRCGHSRVLTGMGGFRGRGSAPVESETGPRGTPPGFEIMACRKSVMYSSREERAKDVSWQIDPQRRNKNDQ